MDYLSRDPTVYLGHVLRGLAGYVRFLESFAESGACLNQADRDYLRQTFAALCRAVDALLATPME